MFLLHVNTKWIYIIIVYVDNNELNKELIMNINLNVLYINCCGILHNCHVNVFQRKFKMAVYGKN